MLRKILKWIGIVLGGLIGLIVLAIVGLLIYGQMSFKPTRANRPLYEIRANTSEAGLARGEYLMTAVMGCTGACHSPEGGTPLSGVSEEINFGPISGVFATPNLTPDAETGLGGWTDAEIARAIREGVDKDGVELVVMPSYNYHVLSDADVAAIVGYLRGLEPVRNEIPSFQLNAPGKIMLALGVFGPSSVGEPITEAQTAPAPGTAEYGGYLVSIGACKDCHQQNLAGGPLPFAEPDAVPAANLTPAGELAGWSEADFITAMTTGQTPSGGTLDESMPWKEYSGMTEADFKDIFEYLKTLPAAETKK